MDRTDVKFVLQKNILTDDTSFPDGIGPSIVVGLIKICVFFIMLYYYLQLNFLSSQ